MDSRWTLENHLKSSGVHLNSVGECKVLPHRAKPKQVHSLFEVEGGRHRRTSVTEHPESNETGDFIFLATFHI